MPPRPSRNLDRALIAAGRELLPLRGCAGITIREVCEAAGVNPGMFHYHFRTREAFLRALLQHTYEDMFVHVTLVSGHDVGPVHNLRAALRVLGRFLRDHRAFISRVLADSLCGDAIAATFLRENMPRHLTLLLGLIAHAQEMGELRAMPVSQAIGVCAGSIAAPILFAGAIEGQRAGKALARGLVTDAAIDERIDLALRALAADGEPRRTKPAPRRRP
jgi:AcrR family transcriptional regulator